jgi:hypothetical protein
MRRDKRRYIVSCALIMIYDRGIKYDRGMKLLP